MKSAGNYEKGYSKMHRVLLVDDEKTTKDGIRFFIESNHFNLEVAGEAENGEEALEKIRELRPDIVLTDIKMPIMDGIELSGHIKKEYPDIKIIFISGLAFDLISFNQYPKLLKLFSLSIEYTIIAKEALL